MRSGHEDAVIKKLIGLGEKYDEIRAVVLTSTRAHPNAPCDIFSDYDAELYVADSTPFAESDDWFEAFGPVLVVFRGDDNAPFQKDDKGRPCCTRLVMYEDGSRIDFQVGPLEALKEDCSAASLPDHLDVGYQVLLDKDGVTASLKRPTFKAHIPPVPTREDYGCLVNNFWWDSTYVAKYLWRDELVAANCMIDFLRSRFLLRMLEWSIEIKQNWTWKPGVCGKGLKQALNPDTYDELTSTYACEDSDSAWQAFYRTTALFSRTAIEVAAGLEYQYPYDLEKRVMIYLKTVEGLDRRTSRREELSARLKEGYGGNPS